MRKLIMALGCAAGMMLASFSAQAAVTVGDAAPDFSLPAADGTTQTLAQHKGKIVVLEWSNKDCPFVRKHYESGNMQDLQKEETAKDIVWLTVLSSAEGKQGYLTADQAKAHSEEVKASPTAILLDPKGEVGKLYDAKTTPHMFVIGKDGVLAYAGAIDDKPSADKADIATADNYVRDAIAALEKGEKPAVTSTRSYGCGVKYAD